MTDEIHYDDRFIAFLEEVWGAGFLSPGGPEEVARILQGVAAAGRRVLDVGCGSGACTVLLAGAHGAAQVTGIDVEAPVCAAARARVAAAGLADRITITQVAPGPFPFADAGFDLVFSKDSIIHIPDKAAMAAEAFRVLAPGGRFAASDWLIAHDGPPSPEMAAYIAAEGLDFAMSAPAAYVRAMAYAGFVEVELVNRNPWYAGVAAKELAWLTGPARTGLDARYGAEFMGWQEDVWTRLVAVLRSGEHCPHHIRARKPG